MEGGDSHGGGYKIQKSVVIDHEAKAQLAQLWLEFHTLSHLSRPLRLRGLLPLRHGQKHSRPSALAWLHLQSVNLHLIRFGRFATTVLVWLTWLSALKPFLKELQKIHFLQNLETRCSKLDLFFCFPLQQKAFPHTCCPNFRVNISVIIDRD